MGLTLIRQRKEGGRQIGSIRRQGHRIRLQGSRPWAVLMSSERFPKPDVGVSQN